MEGLDEEMESIPTHLVGEEHFQVVETNI